MNPFPLPIDLMDPIFPSLWSYEAYFSLLISWILGIFPYALGSHGAHFPSHWNYGSHFPSPLSHGAHFPSFLSSWSLLSSLHWSHGAYIPPLNQSHDLMELISLPHWFDRTLFPSPLISWNILSTSPLISWSSPPLPTDLMERLFVKMRLFPLLGILSTSFSSLQAVLFKTCLFLNFHLPRLTISSLKSFCSKIHLIILCCPSSTKFGIQLQWMGPRMQWTYLQKIWRVEVAD